jgi:hypothetical protein
MPPIPPMPPPHGASAAGRILVLRQVGDESLGGDKQARDRRSTLQRSAHDFRRVDDTGFDHVAVVELLRVETKVFVFAFEQLACDNRTVETGVFDDLAQRSLQRAANDVDTGFLIVIFAFDFVECALT